MFKNDEYIKDLDTIFEDVKFSTNSFIRLKILATLFEKPQNMKEMTENTGLSYSSVSSNIHDLELKNLLYREHNKYFLTASAKLKIQNILLKSLFIFFSPYLFTVNTAVAELKAPSESVTKSRIL